MKFIKNKKNFLFLTGTRADFGELKSLIKILKTGNEFEFFFINYQSK
jgi:UDP-N-acetylglucosamine 2-epimerase